MLGAVRWGLYTIVGAEVGTLCRCSELNLTKTNPVCFPISQKWQFV